jgi:hypothetical protein
MFTDSQIIELVLGYAEREAEYFRGRAKRAIDQGAGSDSATRFISGKDEAFQEIVNLINNLKADTNID